MTEIVLKPGREKSVLKHHPWIFSGAVASLHGPVISGQTVEVISSKGEFLARAAYNPHSNISLRIWTWNEEEQIDDGFFERKLNSAIEIRNRMAALIHSNAVRLIHGESDGIPGLILDRYGDVLVAQFLTAGVEYWKDNLINIMMKCTDLSTLVERSDADVRQLEGLTSSNGILRGKVNNNPLEIYERDLKYWVDVLEGHKTGFYLDQRENRKLAREISKDRNVLDCFSYTGGFSANCLAGNAKHVNLVETSKLALHTAEKNIELNSFDLNKVSFIEEDVFTYLRTLRDRALNFDLVILDPPKFAPTTSQVERATRGYKDINLLALKLLNKGGYLLTFSCSGGVNEELFQKVIAGAAFDAGVDAVILRRLHQDIDHPVALNFPEGNYLNGLLLQRMN